MKIVAFILLISGSTYAQTYCKAQFSDFGPRHECVLEDGKCLSSISDITGIVRDIEFSQNQKEKISVKIRHGYQTNPSVDIEVKAEEARTVILPDQTKVDVICFRKGSSKDIEEQVKKVYFQLSDYRNSNDDTGLCSARSDIWANEIHKISSKSPNKVVILYTKDFRINNWRYHTAPLLTYGKDKWVLEKSPYITKPLNIYEWMLEINHGVACTLITEVNDDIRNAFVKFGRKQYSYTPPSSSDDCYIFETDSSFSSPESGVLGFLPAFHTSTPLNDDRLVESCKALIPNEQDKKPTKKEDLENTVKCKAKLGLRP